jgi:PAS domain S-box-containing protein
VSNSFAEALENPGVMPHIAFRLRTADGSWQHVEVIRNNQLYDPAVKGMVTTTRDITERKRSEERLKRQYNGFPIPTFSFRGVQADFELVDYNEAAAKITRGRLRDMLGIRASEWYSDEPQMLEMLSRCFSEGTTIQGEIPWRMRTTGEDKQLAVTFAYVPPDLVVHHAEDITERKRAEEGIRFQAKLLDTVGQAVIATDSQGKVLYWNQAAEELYGWSEEEAMGHSILEVTPSEEMLEQAEEVMAELMAGRSWSGEFEVRRKDGTTFPAMVTNTPVHDEQGNLVAIIGVSTDITEIKGTEELRRSEERFRLLVEGVKDYAIFMLDAEGHITTWNEGAKRIKGYESQEIVGRHFASFYTDEDVERGHHEEELRLVEEQGCFEEEGWRVRKDGSRFWASVLITALRDGEGNLRGFSKVVRDVTERKKAEEALRESEERFRSTFEEASIGMAVNNLDGRFLLVNRSLCEMLGYSEDELLATTFQAITYPVDLEVDLGHVRWMLDGEVDSFQMEKRYFHAEGHVVWVSLDGSVVRDQEGDPLYLIGQIQDITERKRTDEALRRSEESLTEAQRIAHLGNWEWNLKTGEVWWSDQAYRIFGFEPNEYSPTLKRVEEVFHPEDRHLL